SKVCSAYKLTRSEALFGEEGDPYSGFVGLCSRARQWLGSSMGAFARPARQNILRRMGCLARCARKRAGGRLSARRPPPAWQHRCHGLSQLDVLMEMVRTLVPKSK